MQIEQNLRDEKSERFGFALRAGYSRSVGRMLVLSLLATLSTIVLWLIGYHAENKGLHLRYQANRIKTRRVISYLTLAENVLRHSPLILRRTVLSTVLNHLAKTIPEYSVGLLALIYGDPSALQRVIIRTADQINRLSSRRLVNRHRPSASAHNILIVEGFTHVGSSGNKPDMGT